jgi:hypothetical protein
LLQGGEEAAALLSQLDASEGGEIEMNWNIKVRRSPANQTAMRIRSCIPQTFSSDL